MTHYNTIITLMCIIATCSSRITTCLYPPFASDGQRAMAQLSICSVYYNHYDNALYYPRKMNFTSHICILFVHSPLFSWPSGQNTWNWSR